MDLIHVNNLTKYYGKSRGIENLSFSVHEGEIFGFIGPNGAGKSTTIRLLLSLIHPTSGQATIFGKDVTTKGPEIRSQIGYLPSEVFYYDHMKVGDLLSYSASFYPGDHKQRIIYLADVMELEMHRRIRDLSYGNKKKVGIVQGLLHAPRLIILDEPTSGLDPLMQRTFFDLIQRENERGATVLFSSHILGEVQRICDRVAIIKEGRIVDLRSIDDLRKNSYKKVSFTSAAPVEGFSLAGARQIAQDGAQTSFLYNGEITALLQTLAGLPLINADIAEPDLEEIFLHYYEDAEAGK